jgi:uncharacterized protein YcbK (DUF882 family)
MSYKHFVLEEFQCPCCKEVNMNDEFVKLLDIARGFTKVKFIIESGYRCEKHNAEVGGKPNSAHLVGKASDIKCLSSTERYEIVRALLLAGFNRIGIGKNFVHVDNDETKPHNVIWTYY